MTIRYACNRCDAPGEITSLKFAGNIVVTVLPQPEAHMSLCFDCVAELLLDAVVSLEDTPTAKDYAETRLKAADCSKAYAMGERVRAERDEMAFVHVSELVDETIEALEVGQHITFDEQLSKRGSKPEAVDVKLLASAMAKP